MKLKAIKCYYRVCSIHRMGHTISKRLQLIRKGRTYIVNEASWTEHVLMNNGQVLKLNDSEMKIYFGYERPYTLEQFNSQQKTI